MTIDSLLKSVEGDGYVAIAFLPTYYVGCGAWGNGHVPSYISEWLF